VKIAVVVSGTIRFPEKSIESIKKFDGHDVDVYLHCWKNIEDCIASSWSHVPSEEPYDARIESYNPKKHLVEDWMVKKPEFDRIIEDWRSGPLTERLYVCRVGLLGQYYSLKKAWEMIDSIHDYDLLVRLRFDTLLVDNPLDHKASGFVIPAGNDFGGICDQIAWFWVDKNNVTRPDKFYFSLFDYMDRLIRAGCWFQPESMCALNFSINNIPVHRPEFKYTIH
jgi:hypothetical protein